MKYKHFMIGAALGVIGLTSAAVWHTIVEPPCPAWIDEVAIENVIASLPSIYSVKSEASYADYCKAIKKTRQWVAVNIHNRCWSVSYYEWLDASQRNIDKTIEELRHVDEIPKMPARILEEQK